jgi:hypothetical protein
VQKNYLLPLALCFMFCGCATGTHIVTGTQHPKIKTEQVVLYQVPPPNFEIIGIVNAQSPGHSQRNMDGAVIELKEQAAEIGANGVLLGGMNPGGQSVGVGAGSAFGGGNTFTGTSVGLSESGVSLSGQAIFVAP